MLLVLAVAAVVVAVVGDEEAATTSESSVDLGAGVKNRPSATNLHNHVRSEADGVGRSRQASK